MRELRYDIRIAAANRELVAIRDFRLEESSITVLFGESGIGKTLISMAVFGLLDPDEFDVRINGRSYDAYLQSPEVKESRRNGFFVFQEPSSHLNPLLTLRSQLNEGSLAKAPHEKEILDRLW